MSDFSGIQTLNVNFVSLKHGHVPGEGTHCRTVATYCLDRGHRQCRWAWHQKKDKALGREISALDISPVISEQWDTPGFKFPLRKSGSL